MGTSVSKNALYMTLASVAQKIAAFVYFTFVVQNLIAKEGGLDQTGMYILAFSFTTLFGVFIDLGISNVLVREVAREKHRAGEYLSTILFAKGFLGVLTYGAVIGSAFFLGYSPELIFLIAISGVTMLSDSLHLSLYAILRAFGSLSYEARGMVGSQFLTLAIGSVFLWFNLPVSFFILAFTIPSLLNALYATRTLRRSFHIALRPVWNPLLLRHLAIIAYPFAIAAILARFYSYFDQILLERLMDTHAVALYGVATKITFSFHFLPLAVVAALYPRMSEQHATDRKRVGELFEQAFLYLGLLSLPIAVGTIVVAHDVIHLLYKETFLGSVYPLQILMVSLFFSFLSFPIGAALNACNKQKIQTALFAVTLGVNVALNIYLIPLLGVPGAAFASMTSNIVLTVIGYLSLTKAIPLAHGRILFSLVRLLFCALLMGGIVYGVQERWPLPAAVAVGMLSYPLFLFATGALTKKHVVEIRALFQRTPASPEAFSSETV